MRAAATHALHLTKRSQGARQLIRTTSNPRDRYVLIVGSGSKLARSPKIAALKDVVRQTILLKEGWLLCVLHVYTMCYKHALYLACIPGGNVENAIDAAIEVAGRDNSEEAA